MNSSSIELKNKFKKRLLSLYYCTLNSAQKTQTNQKRIRESEWEAIKQYIEKGNFLDIGCGVGISLDLARKEGCTVFGVDPNPKWEGLRNNLTTLEFSEDTIKKAYSESLPFLDNMFKTVYSSHVLEHVDDLEKTLQEMNRVVSENGVIIIGVPTATMAWINWITQFLFTTHHKIVNILFSKFINTAQLKWWEIFIPSSHCFNGKTIVFDIKNYRSKIWKKKIENKLIIKEIIHPCLYPYPDYIPLFPFCKSRYFSSSVFFICKKK